MRQRSSDYQKYLNKIAKRNARIVEMWNAGIAQPEIAKKVGLRDRRNITGILSRARKRGQEVRMGHEYPPIADTAARNLVILDLWNNHGKTCREIGVVVGLPRGSIARILSKARAGGEDVQYIDRHESAIRANLSLTANRKLQEEG